MWLERKTEIMTYRQFKPKAKTCTNIDCSYVRVAYILQQGFVRAILCFIYRSILIGDEIGWHYFALNKKLRLITPHIMAQAKRHFQIKIIVDVFNVCNILTTVNTRVKYAAIILDAPTQGLFPELAIVHKAKA